MRNNGVHPQAAVQQPCRVLGASSGSSCDVQWQFMRVSAVSCVSVICEEAASLETLCPAAYLVALNFVQAGMLLVVAEP